ncbi:MAG: aspartate--tRNA(Asn) ligase, partial [Deltaproteobacteria bacterium]|nr:aspartate--tRNA(Asn) ligase [Deltaproteobacteria bacterium]
MFKNRVIIKNLGTHVGKAILLSGWVHGLRVLSKFSFLILKDRSGSVQCVVDHSIFDATKLHLEDIVLVEGKVVEDKRSKIG